LGAEVGSSPPRQGSYQRDCYLRGEINQGDAAKLKALLKHETTSGCILYLDSSGGSFDEALKLIDLVIETETPTYVSKGAVCYSACAIVFMGGRRTGEGEYANADRNMEVGARIGFHRPYINVRNDNELIPAAIVKNSYKTAAVQIGKLIEIADRKIVGEVYENILPTQVLIRMLEKESDLFYEINRVEDLIVSGIVLASVGNRFRYYENPNGIPIIVGSSVRNVCNNYNWLRGKYGRDKYFSDDTSHISRSGTTVMIDGDQAERFDGYNGLEGSRRSCYVADVGASFRVRFDDEERDTYVPKVFGLPRGQAISTIRVSYQSRDTQSKVVESIQAAPPSEFICAVIRNNQVVDNDPCALIDRVTTNGTVTEVYKWPSGAKTSVTVIGQKMSINGTLASKVERSNGFTCAQNTKTQNYFCVKPRQ